MCARAAWVSACACVEDCKCRCKVVLPLLHQRIFIFIILWNNVRSFSNSITITVCSCVIIPVVAHIVCVCASFVGVGYFWWGVPDVGWTNRINVITVIHEIVVIYFVVVCLIGYDSIFPIVLSGVVCYYVLVAWNPKYNTIPIIRVYNVITNLIITRQT